MNTPELPLFESNDKFVINQEPHFSSSKSTDINEYSAGIYEQVNSYFQDQDSDLKHIEFLKDILGETASGITDFELANYSTEIQSLVDQWIDEFEEQLFGKPLNELIGTK